MRREDLLEIVIWADLEADVGTLDVSFFFGAIGNLPWFFGVFFACWPACVFLFDVARGCQNSGNKVGK